MSGSLFKKTVIPSSERKWITIDADPSPRGGLPTKVSRMVTKMCRHYDQDEREEDGSYHWETVKSQLLRGFAQERAKEFPGKYWIHLIEQGSGKTRIEYCLDKKKSFCHLRAIQGHSGGIPIRPEMMEYTVLPQNWAVFFTPVGPFGNDPVEEKPHDDYTMCLYMAKHTGNTIKMQCIG